MDTKLIARFLDVSDEYDRKILLNRLRVDTLVVLKEDIDNLLQTKEEK